MCGVWASRCSSAQLAATPTTLSSTPLATLRKREITYWEIVDKVAKYPSPKLEGEGLSDLLKDFIALCLEKSMETRPSSEKLLVLLKENS